MASGTVNHPDEKFFYSSYLEETGISCCRSGLAANKLAFLEYRSYTALLLHFSDLLVEAGSPLNMCSREDNDLRLQLVTTLMVNIHRESEWNKVYRKKHGSCGLIYYRSHAGLACYFPLLYSGRV